MATLYVSKNAFCNVLMRIFLLQLRSLYPDKEHELRYTELVRGYLDFDVEMENISDFWKNSEKLIQVSCYMKSIVSS